MKRLGYLLIMISVGFTACKDKSKFVISGEFKNAEPKSKVYLYGVQVNNLAPIDSTVFSEKGEFKFSHATPGVDFFKIASGHSEYVFIAENGDDIKISADLTDKSLAYAISGAREADKLQELNTTKNAYLGRMQLIQGQFDEAVAKQPDQREMIMQQMAPKYNGELQGLNTAVLAFAKANNESLAGFYAINMLNPAEYEKDMVEFADHIKGDVKQNKTVKDYISKMSSMKTVQVGSKAPDFMIPALAGDPIKLSDFKGKYVLIDFWASWCAPCRQENPNVVKAYNTYKDKNFNILGISLDKDAVAWKKAVVSDNLTWAQAGELKDFEGDVVKLYHVEAIPSNFLIDPNGKIIGKNLRGPDLEAFLSKTL